MNIDSLTVKEKDILKSNGRYGDTELDQVNGEVQHTNKWEHEFLKKAKENGQTKKAEALLAAIGSKSINPKDGLKENFWGWVAAAIGTAAYGAYQDYKDDGEVTLGGMWDNTFGRDGLGSLFGGGSQDALRAQAKGIANEGFETTLKSAEKDLGPEGSIMEAKGDEINKVQLDTSKKTEQISQQGNIMAGKQGFATGGPALELSMKNQMDVVQQGEMQSDAIVDEAVSAQDDIVLGLNSQKNEILSAYMTATDKDFGGSSQLNELQAYIDSYGEV